MNRVEHLKNVKRIEADAKRECAGCEYQDGKYCKWWRTNTGELPPCQQQGYETKVVFDLVEQNSDAEKLRIETELSISGGKLWIRPKGYGDKTSQDGFGYPIGLEVWNGRLRVVLFPDIQEEDATIVDMEDARETNRE